MLGPPPLPRNLEASIRDLESNKPEVRASAVEDVVRHGQADPEFTARAILLLEARLKDEHAAVRSRAAVGLGDLDAKTAVNSLLVAVEDDNGHVREMALNALGEIGDARAAPRLRRALQDERPEVRYQAVIAFSRIEGMDGKEIDAALEAATHDDDDAIVHIALRVGEERIDDGKPVAPKLALRAKTLVEEGSPALKLVSAIYLAKAGEKAGRGLIARVVRGEKIDDEAVDKEDERAAVELAGELEMKELVPFLEKRVWGLAHFVRDTSAFHARIALARMGHAPAKREIIADLSAAKKEVRNAAVVAAGRARIAEAKSEIEKLTKASVDADLVKEALGRLGAANEAGGDAEHPSSEPEEKEPNE